MKVSKTFDSDIVRVQVSPAAPYEKQEDWQRQPAQRAGRVMKILSFS